MQLKVVNLAKKYQFVADALTFDFTYKIANLGGVHSSPPHSHEGGGTHFLEVTLKGGGNSLLVLQGGGTHQGGETLRRGGGGTQF